MPICGIMITKKVVNTKFRNTYNVFATTLAAAADAVLPLLEFEGALMFDKIEFVKSNVWVLNSIDPNDFMVIPHPAVTGDRVVPVNNTVAPLEVTAAFSLGAGSGFPGKKAYRGCYLSAEVTGELGEITDTSVAGIQDIWQAASIDLLETLDGLGVELRIGGSASGGGLRQIVNFAYQGPGVTKMNKRWYNLTPGGGGD